MKTAAIYRLDFSAERDVTGATRFDSLLKALDVVPSDSIVLLELDVVAVRTCSITEGSESGTWRGRLWKRLTRTA